MLVFFEVLVGVFVACGLFSSLLAVGDGLQVTFLPAAARK